MGVSVLVGHFASYRITFADPHSRAHVLESSGHFWTGFLPILLASAALGAVIGTFTYSRAARLARSDTPRRRVHDLLILSIGGTLAYSFLEIGERALHYGDLSGAFHDLSAGGYTTLLVGILFILITAPLLLLVRQGIEYFASRVARPLHGMSVVRNLVSASFARKPLFGLEPNRGPPVICLG